jgi:hypothetical protein
VFDTVSSVLTLVPSGSLGCTLGGIDITPDGKHAFEGDVECGGISELDISADTATSFNLPNQQVVSQYFAFTADSQRAYAASGPSGTVQVFDVNTHASIAVINVDPNPAFGIAIMPPVATATALSSSANSSVFGQQVSFTAIVNPSASFTFTPSGTVTFSDGATTLGTATLISGSAIFNAASLSVGSHSITAAYGGDSNFAPSTSAVVTLVVNQSGSATSLSASPNPANFGQLVTLTATVTAVAPGAGTPTGTVTFQDGTTTLATGALNSAGLASFSTSSLSAGNHSLTTSYSGDTNFTGSTTSSVVTLTVGCG